MSRTSPPITSLDPVSFDPTRSHRDNDTVAHLSRAQTLPRDQRRAVENEVIRLNLPVAATLARRYRGHGIAEEDLQQVAYLGLVRAVRGFSPERGSDFRSFAVPTIRGELRKHFRDLGWVIRPPRRVQELQPVLWHLEAELEQQLQRRPSAEELAEAAGCSIGDVTESMSAEGCFSPTSLDAPTQGGLGDPLLNQQVQEEDDLGAVEARVVLGPAVRRLNERDRRVLALRFYRGLTQREIGEQIGVTQMQVSRLLTRILAQLRADLTPDAA